MSIRVILVFLLVMVVMAVLRGPAFRKGLAKILGIGRRDR